jgi:hypothetical protein
LILITVQFYEVFFITIYFRSRYILRFFPIFF